MSETHRNIKICGAQVLAPDRLLLQGRNSDGQLGRGHRHHEPTSGLREVQRQGTLALGLVVRLRT